MKRIIDAFEPIIAAYHIIIITEARVVITVHVIKVPCDRAAVRDDVVIVSYDYYQINAV